MICMPCVSTCKEVSNAVAEKVGLEMALSVLVSIGKIKIFLSLSASFFFFFLNACNVTV